MCHTQKLDGLRLLVVDDDPDTRELLTILFSGEGAEIIAAASVVEALEALSCFQPDMLISDISLPDEDGYSLLQKVRKLDASQRGQIPAIALTAHVMDEDRARALSAGFDRHLSKPTDLDELTSVVKSLACQTKVSLTSD